MGCSCLPKETFPTTAPQRPRGDYTKGARGFMWVLRTETRGQRSAWRKGNRGRPHVQLYDSQSLLVPRPPENSSGSGGGMGPPETREETRERGPG